MPEVEDFLPIFPEETEQTVLDRLLVWLNDGVDPGDPTWIDPREGGMARTLLVPASREMAILYDRISTEFPAAAHPLFAWGWYLEQWALSLGTERLAATYADGTVTFTAADGTVIDAGTEVGVVSGTGVSFLTQSELTIGGSGSGDVAIRATEAGVAGNVAAGAITAILSAVDDPNTTVTNAEATTGGTDEETDEALRERVLGIYASSPGGGNVADYLQWVRSVPGVGGAAITPEVSGPGTVGILATTPTGDPVSAGTQQTIRDYLDPIAIESTPTGVTATTITVPSTAGFRTRGILHIGTLTNDRTHTYTGVTATQFTGVAAAPTLNGGDKVWQTGRGGGRAPVGHHDIVGTGVALNVAIVATLELDPGYTLTAGTSETDLTDRVTQALREYIDTLAPGQEIVRRRVESVILGVTGVYDIAKTTINGTAGNVTPITNQVPTLTTPTLTEGVV